MLRVSVIIPTLNEEAEIASALSSVHDAGADELIVVDGGSSDRTVQIAKDLNAVVFQPENCGRAIQQNFGAERATGDVLLFLHADCRIPPDGINEVRQLLQDAPLTLSGCFSTRLPGNQSSIVVGWPAGHTRFG